MALGVSPAAWGRRLASGDLVAVHPGVARLAAARVTVPQQALALVLATGHGAMASHTACARRWGAPLEPWRPEVTIPGRAYTSRLRGVIVHRSTGADLRPLVRLGVPVTSPLRALVDLADVALVEEALDHFVLAGLVTPAAVAMTVERHRHRPGVAALRQVVERWSLPGADADSRLEVLMSELCAAHRLPTPVFHYRVGPYELDVAFPHERRLTGRAVARRPAMVAAQVDQLLVRRRSAA